jgi:hypothetical protein
MAAATNAAQQNITSASGRSPAPAASSATAATRAVATGTPKLRAR